MQEYGSTHQAHQRRVSKLPGHTRDRRGCITCRKRKKKCDNAEGRCNQCSRLNLHCEWEPERHVLATTRQRSPTWEIDPDNYAAVSQLSVIVKAPDPLQFWLQATEESGSAELWNRRLALRYYIQSFAAILACNVENNGFLSVLLPMAIESPPLMDSMIACSTSHLALCRADLHVKALEHKSLALTSFVSSVTTGNLSQEFSLAACLILCSMESILGDTSAWYDHLSGAACIIKGTLFQGMDSRPSSTLQRTTEGRWLLRNFAYHDILASVSLNSDLLIPGRYWMSDENVLDTYFGLASLPMAMIAEISSLRVELNQIEEHLAQTEAVSIEMSDDSPMEDTHLRPDLLAKAGQIEAHLLDWEPHGNHEHALICLAQSYRSAALIYLYRVLRFHRLRPSEVLAENFTKQIILALQHVEAMPIACLPECTLLFPLFLAGGEAVEPSTMQKIRNRMNEIVAHRRFENVRIGLVVLEEVWDVKSRTHPVDSSRPYDWLDVLQRRGWKLALS